MKTILVLTDFSDAAENAALYASALTHQLETTRLILYHSYESIPAVGAAFPLSEPVNIEALHKDSIEELTELKNWMRTFVREGTDIDLLADDRPLIQAVDEIGLQLHAGLIVMGITGKGRLKQVLIGSNAINIGRESLFPVLLVPSKARFEKIRRVAFACDLKDVSAATPVTAIKSLIHELKSRLLVLNVDTEDEEHFAPDTLKEQTVLHQLWDNEEAEYHYTHHEDLAEGIKQFASEHNIQIVIAVPKKHGFFESIFKRSMTNKLAFGIDRPLLLIKEKKD